MRLRSCVLYLHGNYTLPRTSQREASGHRRDILHARPQHTKAILETQPRTYQKPKFLHTKIEKQKRKNKPIEQATQSSTNTV